MRVERFVRLIVGGGIALVAGLWVVAIGDPWSFPWLVGLALSALGLVTLLAGIASEISLRG